MAKKFYILEHASPALAGEKPPVTINGKSIDYEIGVPIELDTEIAASIANSDVLTVRPAPDAGSDAAVAQSGGSDDSGDSLQGDDAPDRSTTDVTPANPTPDTFDAASVREGKLDEVGPRIAKLETAEQIEAVRQAEKDADGRKGVGDLLDARLAEISAA